MSAVLSGEQLVQAHAKTNYDLPAIGVKEFQPNNSWLEQQQIQSALQERKALLEEERVEKWSCLMSAEWVPEKRKACVKQKNKHWEVYGHHSAADDSDWLFPEEVLFLMEMNCLECVYGEVPLSIQKGYSVLLGPENGCSLTEYRVFAHLCRTGYRVVRHLPDLTVTAYERQIRLDQHLEQKKTYDEEAGQLDLVRPDLPPKKIVELTENAEITLESSGTVPAITVDGSGPEVAGEQISGNDIEVIDIADSSSEESDSYESVEEDSDIEILEVFEPAEQSLDEAEEEEEEEEDDDDDDDIEIIEVDVPNKNIIVATIDSSDSEKEGEGSDSESNKSYDGNWKRSPSKKQRFGRLPNMNHLNFLAVEEFCAEKPLGLNKLQNCNSSTSERIDVVDNSDGDNKSDSVDFISFQPSLERSRQLFPVRKSRNEILDLLPTMAGHSSKIMTVDTPDLRLVPDNIVPKQQLYTFNTNSLRARVFSTRGFRGRRFFHGPRFSGYNPLYNNSTGFNNFPNQVGVGGALLQTPSIMQMFGSDVHSMARGMMQFASALLYNAPQNNQSNSLPYQHSQSSFNDSGFSQTDFSPRQSFDGQSRNFLLQSHTGYSGSPVMMGENIHQSYQDRGFGSDRSIMSRSSGGDSDFVPCERTFTPPIRRGGRGIRGYCPRPFSRDTVRRLPTPRFTDSNFPINLPTPIHTRFSDSNFPVDPAYIKPDVPLPEEQSIQIEESEDFIPVRSSTTQVPTDVSEVVDISNDESDVPTGRGISKRYQQKRKRTLGKNRSVKRRFQRNGSGEDAVIIFLDSPTVSSTLPDVPVKQETNEVSTVNIKSENITEQNSSVAVKQEADTTSTLKSEPNENNGVNSETDSDLRQETLVKHECNDGVRVKCEQDPSGKNLRIEIKIESSSDTSSVSSLPITSLVKSEPSSNVKLEPRTSDVAVSSTDVKEEPTVDAIVVKSENGSGLNENENHSLQREKELCLEEREKENSSDQSETQHSSVQMEVDGSTVEKETQQSSVQMEVDGSTVEKETQQSSVQMEVESSSNQNETQHSSVQMEVESCSNEKETQHSTVQSEIEQPLKKNENDGTKNQIEVESVSENKDSESLSMERITTSDGIDTRNLTEQIETEFVVPSSTISDHPMLEVNIVPVEKPASDSRNLTEQIETEFVVPSSTISDHPMSEVNIVPVEKPASEFERNEADVESGVDGCSRSNENCGVEMSVDSRICGETSKTVGETDIVVSGEVLGVECARTMKTVTIECRDNSVNNVTECPSSQSQVSLNFSEPEGDVSSGEISRTKESECSEVKKNNASHSQGSSWAEVKKSNLPLSNFQASEVEREREEEDDGEIQPLIKPRDCKTIGTVLSALQIFSPFSPQIPENIPKLKISFDMYLPTDFRKAQRGLPQFRIVVFGGKDPVPSPAQLLELQTRFKDSVPVLRAVVTSDSVVFYTCSNVSLPIDITSYRN